MSKKNNTSLRPKIIAELCQNHNGKFKLLEQMVAAAAQAGASHVKIQTIYSRNLVFRPEFETGYKKGKIIYSKFRPWSKEFQRIKRLEISSKNCERFVKICHRHNVEPLTTCFTRDTIQKILNQGFREVKIASYDCSSYQLLREVAKAGFKCIYVSTGATYPDELAHSAKILSASGVAYELLHCVTIYPTPLEMIRLSKIQHLRKWGVPVGFSDHTSSLRLQNLASMVAMYLGAEVIERHFTLLPPNKTKDGKISIGPEDLGNLVSFSKMNRSKQKTLLRDLYPKWQKLIGKANTCLSREEKLNRDYYRGRFASCRPNFGHERNEVIFNWEETPL